MNYDKLWLEIVKSIENYTQGYKPEIIEVSRAKLLAFEIVCLRLMNESSPNDLKRIKALEASFTYEVFYEKVFREASLLGWLYGVEKVEAAFKKVFTNQENEMFRIINDEIWFKGERFAKITMPLSSLRDFAEEIIEGLDLDFTEEDETLKDFIIRVKSHSREETIREIQQKMENM